MDFSIGWKKFFIVFLLFAISFGAFAQQNHFIYLQTENNQLFYLKLNGQVISSSSAGYLILPNLPDGPLQLVVGFPKNEFPEEKFDLNVDNKNIGFLLKNLPGQGWILFNLQSLAVINRSSVESPVTVVKTATKDDAFSSLLANAVNDSSLFQHNNIAADQQQSKQTNEVASDDTSSKNVNPLTGIVPSVQPGNNRNDVSDTVANNIVSTLPVSNPDRIKRDTLRVSDTVFVKGKDGVNKILGVNDPKGMDMVYTVKKPAGEDTVRIFLPATISESPDSLSTVTNNLINKSKDSLPTISPTVVPSVDISAVHSSPKDTTFLSAENTGVAKSDSLLNKSDDSRTTANDNIIHKSKDSTFTITPTIIPPDYKPAEKSSSNDSSIVSEVNPVVAKVDSLQENRDSISPLNNKQIIEPKTNEVNAASKRESEIIVMPQAVTSSEVNSDCHSFATDQDFLKVRRKMAATTGRENMVEAARKFFKLKCYSTEQIKNLSYLFLTDEGKYLFFDMAYAFASDSNLYPTLQTQLEDPYYLNRFKAMIRK